MTQHFIFILFGLANGAVYAALGLTLVVTYRSSGVVNFSTGAMSLFGAYFYAYFRKGELFVPIPLLPKTVDLGFTPGFWPAAIVSVLFCALFGLLLYIAVFRPLRSAPPVAKAVVSVGVMVVFTGLFTAKAGTVGLPVETILPTTSWKVGKVLVPTDRVWFALAVVSMTLVLVAVYRFTRFGLVTRAVAATEKGAFVSGIAPDRVAAANWMIGAAVAAISGILISPIVPLTPLGYTLFIVPAMAAAILGQFMHMGRAVIGGMAIGTLQSEFVLLKGQHKWLPTSGISELIPLLLILIVLVARAKPLPSRGVVLQQTLGRAPRPTALLRPSLVGSAIGVIGLVALQGPWRSAMIMSMIMAIIALSQVVVTGYAGQISLAQLTLAGVAGFLLGPMTSTWNLPLVHTTIPFPFAPVVAAAIAAVVGVVIGLPALRIRGLPVAVVTLALGVALEAVWFRNPDFVSADGKNINGPEFFGIDLRARVGANYPRLQFGLLLLGVLVVVAVGVAKLRTSRLGSAMLAVRANERSAAGVGIDVVRVKLIAFAIGSFIAGLGGAMLGYFQGNVTFVSFTTFVGLGLFVTAYIAGITSVSGGILAGVTGGGGLVALVLERVLSLGDWFGVITGVGLVYTVIKNPEGIVGPIHTALARRRARQSTTEPGAAVPLEGRLVPIERVEGGCVILSTEQLRVAYGGMVAVNQVDLEVREGTIVGLIGPNGAGKTTLLDALSGFTSYRGKVLLDGRDLVKLSPHQRARASLGRTFQHTQLYDDLTVTENIEIGAAAAHGRVAKSLQETLELLDLASLAERPVGELSQGRRQLVSIACALIGNPRVLLLDEPAGGLDSKESQWLGIRLRRIRDTGVTILLIDHDMHLVLNLCDSIYVLNFGEVIAHGSPAAIKADRGVAAAYLGSTHAEVAS